MLDLIDNPGCFLLYQTKSEVLAVIKSGVLSMLSSVSPELQKEVFTESIASEFIIEKTSDKQSCLNMYKAGPIDEDEFPPYMASQCITALFEDGKTKEKKKWFVKEVERCLFEVEAGPLKPENWNPLMYLSEIEKFGEDMIVRLQNVTATMQIDSVTTQDIRVVMESMFLAGLMAARLKEWQMGLNLIEATKSLSNNAEVDMGMLLQGLVISCCAFGKREDFISYLNTSLRYLVYHSNRSFDLSPIIQLIQSIKVILPISEWQFSEIESVLTSIVAPTAR